MTCLENQLRNTQHFPDMFVHSCAHGTRQTRTPSQSERYLWHKVLYSLSTYGRIYSKRPGTDRRRNARLIQYSYLVPTHDVRVESWLPISGRKSNQRDLCPNTTRSKTPECSLTERQEWHRRGVSARTRDDHKINPFFRREAAGPALLVRRHAAVPVRRPEKMRGT